VNQVPFVRNGALRKSSLDTLARESQVARLEARLGGARGAAAIAIGGFARRDADQTCSVCPLYPTPTFIDRERQLTLHC
jgi:hypothetical protein